MASTKVIAVDTNKGAKEQQQQKTDRPHVDQAEVEQVNEQPVSALANASDESSESAGSSGAAAKRRDLNKLRVVLPSNHKSLVTPTILAGADSGATPSQLLSSLVQLNGHFTGLPSCTPTSADRLPVTGDLASMNPFFWGVGAFNGSSGESHQLGAGESGQPAAELEEILRRAQPAKGEALQFILSPLSFLLSPEHANSWRRLNQAAGRCAAGQQQESPTSTADMANRPAPKQIEPNRRGSTPSAQDLSSPQQSHQPAHSHEDLAHAPATSCAVTSQGATTSLDVYQSSYPQPEHFISQQLPSVREANELEAHANQSRLAGLINATSSLNTGAGGAASTITLTCQPLQAVSPDQDLDRPSVHQRQSSQQASSAMHPLQPRSPLPAANQSPGQLQPHQHQYQHPGTSVAYLQQQQQNNQLAARPIRAADPRLSMSRQSPSTSYPPLRPTPAMVPPIRIQAPGASYQQAAVDSIALQYETSQPIGLYDQHLRHFYLVQQRQQHQSPQQLGGQPPLLYHSGQLDNQLISHHHHHHHQHHLPQYHHHHAPQVPHHLVQPQFQHSMILAASQQQQHPLVSSSAASASGLSKPVPSAHQAELGRQTEPGDALATLSTDSPTALVSPGSQAKQDRKIRDTRLSQGEKGTQSHPGGPEVKSHENLEFTRDHNSPPDASSTAYQDLVTNCRPISETTIEGSTKKSSKIIRTTKTIQLKDQPPDSLSTLDGSTEMIKKKSRGGRKKKQISHEELIARKNRCKERNRVAAKRCRQKRKQFLDDLHGRIDCLNDSIRKLQRENTNLKDELELLRKHHKTCRLVAI